jgi:hypothetical protein
MRNYPRRQPTVEAIKNGYNVINFIIRFQAVNPAQPIEGRSLQERNRYFQAFAHCIAKQRDGMSELSGRRPMQHPRTRNSGTSTISVASCPGASVKAAAITMPIPRATRHTRRSELSASGDAA